MEAALCWFKLMNRLAILATALFALTACMEQATVQPVSAPLSLAANEISAWPGNVRVIDADTIALSGRKIRLNGISAAERGHPAYRSGQAFVRQLVAASDGVICSLNGEVTFDREVGTCFVVKPDGQRMNMQAAVVSAGLARDCPRYSGGRYASAETAQSRAQPLPGYCRR